MVGCLLSLSLIITVALIGSSTVTPLGRELGSIERVKLSLTSFIMSSYIGILNPAWVSPAYNETLYGPEA